MEGNPSGTLEQQVAYLLTQVSSLTQANQDLTTALDAQTQKLLLLEASVQGEVANLTTNQDSLQTILNTHSQSLSNETTARGVVDNGLTTEVVDLKDQHLNDHTYLIGLVEEHHGEWMAASASHTGAMINEQQARIVGDETNASRIESVRTELVSKVDALDAEVATYNDVLDFTTMDTLDLTMDSDYPLDWSVLSASQEWRFEIDDYLRTVAKEVKLRLDAAEQSVVEANTIAEAALSNTDISALLSTLSGQVTFDILDPTLTAEIQQATTGLMQEKLDRAQDILLEANKRIEALTQIKGELSQETQERIDSISQEALIRNQSITLLSETVDSKIASVTEQITIFIEENLVMAQRMDKLEAEFVPNLAGSDQPAGAETSVSYENTITTLASDTQAVYNELQEAKTSFTNSIVVTEGKISDLTTSVSDLDGNVTRRLTELESSFTGVVENSLNPLETSLNETKANLQNNYYTKAEADSATASTTATLTTTMNNSIANIDAVKIPDTRYDNQPPSWYWANYPRKTVTEFKMGSYIGSPGGVTGYGSLLTVVPWNDSSGSAIRQIFQTGDGLNEFTRYSTSTTEWSAWVGYLKDTRTTVTEQTASINGIMGVKTVTIDNNGVLSGYGLISQLKDGQVTSGFGINADQFYVGAPASGKKPFLVLTSQQTINGKVYPAGTWIDAAYIANASIDSAKIGNLDASKITTGEFAAARIGANTITADKLNVTSLSALSARIGTLRTATEGARTEISDNQFRVFDANGVERIFIGVR